MMPATSPHALRLELDLPGATRLDRAQITGSDSQRFEVQFVLNLMKDGITDDFIVPERDDGATLCRQRLVPHPSIRLGRFRRTVGILRGRMGEATGALTIMQAQPVEMFRHRRAVRFQLIKSSERRLRGL